MTILASFNYYGPPAAALVGGAAVALAVLVILARCRSVVLGIVCGAVVWGVIAFLVFGAGSGDMVGLMRIVYGTTFAVAGAVLGSAAALIGKLLHRRTKSQ
jgi:hypothetical protein